MSDKVVVKWTGGSRCYLDAETLVVVSLNSIISAKEASERNLAVRGVVDTTSPPKAFNVGTIIAEYSEGKPTGWTAGLSHDGKWYNTTSRKELAGVDLALIQGTEPCEPEFEFRVIHEGYTDVLPADV